MKDFFLDKFEFDFYTNKLWSNHLLEQEEFITPFILKSASHIINVHHIWNSRLIGTKPESNIWDELPLDFFVKLHQNNFDETRSFLEQCELDEKINYHDSEGVKLSKFVVDVLYHLLNHSNYHRAQIALELRKLSLPVPVSNFITYR